MSESVSLTPVPTGLTLPDGPVTVDFREAIASALDAMIPPGRKGALLAVASHDSATNKTTFVFGVATKLDEAGNWKLGGDVQWDGSISGRVMLMRSW